MGIFGSCAGLVQQEGRGASLWPDGDFRNQYFPPARLAEAVDRVDALKRLVPPGMTLPEMALRFILSHPAVSTVIPGMRTVPHVEDNCAAAGKKLSAEELTELKKQAWPRNFYPVYDK